MSLPPGTRLGPYEIIAAVGAGGMGEVYRARDTKLQRDVAIKVLPDVFAADPDRLARFEREAQTLASLNHPNIAQIHGLQDGPDDAGHQVRALVMEFVEGEDLSARIGRGRVPVEEGVLIARQVAEALEAAHEQGIIHRDLKPANIKVRPDGTVKVLDFGLAKIADAFAQSAEAPAQPYQLANSPTFTSPVMTQMGVILGTAAYMAPEQAKGRPVDRRVDIWAFGVIVYELLTGRQLFAGETLAETIGLVVTRDPDLTLLPPETPLRVRELLRRCLERDPRQRLRDAGEARIALAAPAASDMPAEAPRGPMTRRVLPIASVAAIVALLAGVAAGPFLFSGTGAAVVPEFAFDISVPGRQIVTGSLALSPDGSRVAFRVRLPDGSSEIWIRTMGDPAPRPLPGTTDPQGSRPFWSPDGRHIGFFSNRDVWRIGADGTAPRRLATAPLDPRGGAWGSDDVILFGTEGGTIFRVTASGGSEPTPATTMDGALEEMHVWPAFLPDGKQFVYLVDGTSDEAHRIRVASIAHNTSKILLKAIRSSPAVDARGALLLSERGQLMTYALDLRDGTLGGASSALADGVFAVGDRHILPAAIAGGTLVYQRTAGGGNIVRVSLESGEQTVVTGGERFANLIVSPDGRQIAFDAVAPPSSARLIWIYDLERGVRTLMSEQRATSDSPAWSARGDTVYFNSNLGAGWQVYRKQATGSGSPELVGAPPDVSDVGVQHCSPDGKYLLSAGQAGGGNWDLFLLPLDSPGAAWQPWVATPAVEAFGRFSPDSRWIAYTSNVSGRVEIYVSRVEDPARRWQISSSGGTSPVWGGDGTRLYYRSATDELMVVELDLSGSEVRSKAPRAQLELLTASAIAVRNMFDLLPDGKTLFVIRRLPNEEAAIHVRTGMPVPR